MFFNIKNFRTSNLLLTFAATNKTKMEEKIKIVKIDVDGVLRDLTSAMCMLYNDYFGTSLTPDMLTNYDVDHEELFRRTIDEYHQLPSYWFFIDNGEQCFGTAPTCTGAAESVKKLREDGFHVAICTWQMNYDNKCHTLDWLDFNGIEYDSIHFTKQKWMVNGDYMIDDNMEFLSNPLDTTKDKFLIRRPYNDIHLEEAKRLGIIPSNRISDAVDVILQKSSSFGQDE